MTHEHTADRPTRAAQRRHRASLMSDMRSLMQRHGWKALSVAYGRACIENGGAAARSQAARTRQETRGPRARIAAQKAVAQKRAQDV